MPAVELVLVDLAQDDVPARLGADLGDPVAHQAAADNSNLADRHVLLELLCRRVDRFGARGSLEDGTSVSRSEPRSRGRAPRSAWPSPRPSRRRRSSEHEHHLHLGDQAVVAEREQIEPSIQRSPTRVAEDQRRVGSSGLSNVERTRTPRTADGPSVRIGRQDRARRRSGTRPGRRRTSGSKARPREPLLEARCGAGGIEARGPVDPCRDSLILRTSARRWRGAGRSSFVRIVASPMLGRSSSGQLRLGPPSSRRRRRSRSSNSGASPRRARAAALRRRTITTSSPTLPSAVEPQEVEAVELAVADARSGRQRRRRPRSRSARCSRSPRTPRRASSRIAEIDRCPRTA